MMIIKNLLNLFLENRISKEKFEITFNTVVKKSLSTIPVHILLIRCYVC